jgi:integrase
MMMSDHKSKPSWSKSIPFDLWPVADQAAWKAAHVLGDVLDPGGVASRWSPPSKKKAERGYGRYLFFLLQRSELDPTTTPAERVTRERLIAYLDELQCTNRGHTPHNRIQELGDAMRALAPDGDWRWILRAAGRLRASTIPAHNKRERVRPIEELVAQGLRLIKDAESNHALSSLGRALQCRDGLIMVFLGLHPMRLRNLAELELGCHLLQADDQFILRLLRTKGGQSYEGPVDPTLKVPLRRYLDQHRPILLQQRGRWYAAPGKALWISKHGSRCSEDTFENVVRKRTGDGERPPLSPHLFRTCAATSVAINAPESIYIIPAILTHGSHRTGEHFYNLAGSLEASRAHNAVLDELRRDLSKPSANL